MANREDDLSDALAALVAHYKRHTDHRCEILENAEQVLAGHPLPRFELPDDLGQHKSTKVDRT